MTDNPHHRSPAIADLAQRLDDETRAAKDILACSTLRVTLASASPRRSDLLRRVLSAFDVSPADIPEIPRPGESPHSFARRTAREKAEHIAAHRPKSWVLGADTVVTIDDDILGKPRDEDDAQRMLRQLAGRAHRVVTAVALVTAAGTDHVVVETEVAFRPLAAVEIGAYVATGEPFDKAGAYAIQGRAAAFVTRVAGSSSNVIGLPLVEVARLLGARSEYAAGTDG